MEGRTLRPRNLNVNYNISLSPVREDVLPSIRYFQKSSSPSIKIPLTHSLPASNSTPRPAKLGIREQILPADGTKKSNKGIQQNQSTSITSKPGPKSKKGRITKYHSASALQLSLPELPDFEPLEHPVPLHKAYNTLPRALRSLNTLKPFDIFNLYFSDDIIDVIMTNTNRYAQRQMELNGNGNIGRNSRWQPVSASEIWILLGITIHMGCLGLSTAYYWRRDGRLLSRDGLPTAAYMSQMRFEEIRRYFHISDPEHETESWHSKIDPLLNQVRRVSQQNRVPSSNVTVDEAMILFTGRSIHITKMPNKPIGMGYKFFALADKGFVWDFHPSSNTDGLDPVSMESANLSSEKFSNTTRMVHHLARRLYLKHRSKAWNIYMDNYFTTVPLLAELRRMGIGGCGTAKANLKGYPDEFKSVTKKSKLEYQFRSGVVKDGVGCLLWVDSAPVSMMSTIHSLKDRASKSRWHPGAKSTNAAAANEIYHGEQQQIELLIPLMVLSYNIYKVGVDVADQYRTYYDTQLTSRRNWYPIFYWCLETTLINSLIIYRDERKDSGKVDHLEFRLDIAWSLIEKGRGVGITRGAAKRNTSSFETLETPPPKRANVTKNTKLPPSRFSSDRHLPVYMGGERRDCFLCRWKRSLAGEVGKEIPKIRWKCATCNEPLCLLPGRNCFHEFHVS